MCKFISINSPFYDSFALCSLPALEICFHKYFKYFQDDFSNITDVMQIIQNNPYFWLIFDSDDNFMGFVFLDNFVGNNERLYSAELTTCFERRAWGNFTKYCAKFFLKKCFDELGLQKIKAQIYPDNFRVKSILKTSGFIYECTLKNETLRGGKLQDIDVYALYRTYYYK